MTARHENSRGFNLTELMIVVMLVGIVAALTLPRFGRFLEAWKLENELGHVAGTLRTARSAAVMKNIDTVFEFDTNDNTFWYFEDANGNGVRNNDEYRSATYSLSTGVSFGAYTLPEPKVVFGPKGNASNGGTIALTNGRKHSRHVSIFGGTGNVSVN